MSEYTREEMREACEQNYRAGVLAEQERCARIAEKFPHLGGKHIAAAIRESEEMTTVRKGVGAEG